MCIVQLKRARQPNISIGLGHLKRHLRRPSCGKIMYSLKVRSHIAVIPPAKIS